MTTVPRPLPETPAALAPTPPAIHQTAAAGPGAASEPKVSTRLSLAIGLLIVLLIAVGAAGLLGLSATNGALQTVYDDRVVPLGQLGQVQRLMAANQAAVEAAVRQPGQLGKAEALVRANRGAIDTVWAAYMATKLTIEEAALAREFATERAAFVQQGLLPTLQALRQGDTARAEGLLGGALATGSDRARTALEKLMALQVEVAQQEFVAAQSRYRTLLAATVALIAFGAGGGVVLGWRLQRALMRRLGGEPAHAAALVRAVSEGDLAVPIQLRAGDTTSLMAALQQMQAGLQRTVSVVRRDADSVATASAEIAQGTHDLSQRTEEQASALQQTAASMEQLTSTVRQNADHAQTARQLAEGAADVAQRGGEVVQHVVQTMKGIEDSSRRIAEIIGVIDGIAFQTNILALNAAVEAARAGEQGRGFAVVAGEVRNLAQRCTTAAREVKTLINDSVTRVDNGTELVGQAGTRMDEIVTAIARVKDLVAEISAASVEQSSGVAQIGGAVTQMDQVTQQNAALVEESSAAAESLRGQAAHLLDAVSVFRLPASGGTVPLAPAAQPLAGAARALANTPRTAARQVAARPAMPVAVAAGDDGWARF
jgi:methyl-accepting chemotaxis protein